MVANCWKCSRRPELQEREGQWAYECGNCGARSPFGTEEDAARWWNKMRLLRRATRACTVAASCAWLHFDLKYQGGPPALQRVLDAAREVVEALQFERLQEAGFRYLAILLRELKAQVTYAGRKL